MSQRLDPVAKSRRLLRFAGLGADSALTFEALGQLRDGEMIAKMRGLNPDSVEPYQSYSDING